MSCARNFTPYTRSIQYNTTSMHLFFCVCAPSYIIKIKIFNGTTNVSGVGGRDSGRWAGCPRSTCLTNGLTDWCVSESLCVWLTCRLADVTHSPTNCLWLTGVSVFGQTAWRSSTRLWWTRSCVSSSTYSRSATRCSIGEPTKANARIEGWSLRCIL